MPPPSPGPLAGLRVLDFTRLLPGGYCTMLLADFGAEVIKVEQPVIGDYIRSTGPRAASGQSGAHETLNRGKLSIALDLKDPASIARVLSLVPSVDVVIESFRPGVMARLGLGYEALSALNQRLIYASITGYGQTGPLAQLAGHDLNYLAYSGALSFSGAGGTPEPTGLQIADLGAGGQAAVIALLAALHERQTSGRGQYCDVNMTSGVMSWLSVHAGWFAASGRVPQAGAEMLNGGWAWYGTYACSDGRYLAIGAVEEHFFINLVAALGRPDLAKLHGQELKQSELRAELTRLFAERPRDAWIELLADVDTCIAPVRDMREVFDDPLIPDVLDAVQLPDGARFPLVGVVPHLSRTPGIITKPAPRLGEHNDLIFGTSHRTPPDPAFQEI